MPLLSNNFRSGEISPRLDILKAAAVVQDGLLKARNVTVKMQGGCAKRPGLRLLTRLPTGDNWRRIFAWNKSDTERLTVCYADNGKFRVVTENGVELDVSGRGNTEAQDDMQFTPQGVRGVFTDKRELRHLIGLPRPRNLDAILLTSETQSTALLRNFAAASGDYSPPADQPITLTAVGDFAAKRATLSVRELRMKFTPAAQSSSATSNFGVFRQADFTNNPQTYKNPTTTITVNQVWVQRSAGGNQNKMRVSLSPTFPAWVEKVVVRWGEYYREFTANNQYADVALRGTADDNDTELGAWIEARGDYSVEIVRRLDTDASLPANPDRQGLPIFSRLEDNNTVREYYRDYTSDAPAGVNGVTINVTQALRLRVSDWNSLDNRFLFTLSAPAGQAFPTGRQIRVEVEVRKSSPDGEGLRDHTRFTLGTITAREGANQVNWTSAALSAMQFEIRNADPNSSTAVDQPFSPIFSVITQNKGLEANEADFHAMGIETIDGVNRAVYIRGRDFFRLNPARGLERQPLKENRVVTALVVDDDLVAQSATALNLYQSRVVDLVEATPRRDTGDRLKEVLTTSEFWAFRASIMNPPVHLHTDPAQFTTEVARIGARFCVQTGSSHSEYELEWKGDAPVDSAGHALTPVGGAQGSQNNRPELARQGGGITDIFEDPADNNTVKTVTGWKYSPASGANANQIVDNIGSPDDADYDQFNNIIIADYGTLIAKGIDAAAANIGVAPGRYSMVWNDVDGYPTASQFTQGRLCYAGTRAFPSTIWMSFIRNSSNFLAQRPAAGDPKSGIVHADYALEYELDSSAIQSMVADALLLVFTREEANTIGGAFLANDLSRSSVSKFGRFGQQYNLGAPRIDEHVFTYSDGAAYGMWYESVEIGYQPKNISAIRNDDIFRNYKDAVIRREDESDAPAEDGGLKAITLKEPVASLADITLDENTLTNSELRPVRIVSAQPENLNGAFLVLFLMSDGTIRVWHTLHNQQFFAWARWDFFGVENAVGTTTEKRGTARRKIVDIASQGEFVTLLDDEGNIYVLDGSQAWDDFGAGENTPARIGIDEGDAIEVELETPSVAEPRYEGEALLNPKSARRAMLYFQAISGVDDNCESTTTMEARGNKNVVRKVEFNPKISGEIEEMQTTGTAEKTVRSGRRYVNLGVAYAGREDTEKVFSCVIKNTSKYAWELSRLDIDVDVEPPPTRAAAMRGAVAS